METDLARCFGLLLWDSAREKGLSAGAVRLELIWNLNLTSTSVWTCGPGEPDSQRGMWGVQEREQYPQPFSARVAFHGPKRIRSQWRAALCQVSSSDQNCLHRTSVNTQANLSPSDVICEGLLLHLLLTWEPLETQTTEGLCNKRYI